MLRREFVGPIISRRNMISMTVTEKMQINKEWLFADLGVIGIGGVTFGMQVNDLHLFEPVSLGNHGIDQRLRSGRSTMDKNPVARLDDLYGFFGRYGCIHVREYVRSLIQDFLYSGVLLGEQIPSISIHEFGNSHLSFCLGIIYC